MTDVVTILERTLRGDLSWVSSSDWSVEAVVASAAEHGVQTLLWEALPSSPGPSAALREALAPRVRNAATIDLIVQREMDAVLRSLVAAGIPALVIKGSALAYTVYARPWQRPRTDTDLLVGPGDVAAASHALEQSGYAKSDALTSGTLVSHQLAFERTDAHGMRHVIDLHWKIVNPQILADALPFDELWKEAQPAVALGPAARVPSLVANLALACIHRLAHHQGHERLIWLYDMRLLSARFGSADWDQLGQLAVDRHVSSLCLDGLAQARARLGSAFPERLEAILAASAPHEPSHRYLEGAVNIRDVLTSDLVALDSWRDRLRLLREHAFPPPAFMRARYGVRSPLLLPALYIHRLVTGAYKWVRP